MEDMEELSIKQQLNYRLTIKLSFMKKQFYLLIPILLLMLSNQAHAQEPTPISTYEHFDLKYNEGLLSNYNAGEELVDKTFCENAAVEITVVQQGNVPYQSYKWYHIDGSGSEVDLNNDQNSFSFTNVNTHYSPGYHLFRVYAYSEEGLQGCFEVTEMAVYILPALPQEDIVDFNYCETDASPVNADDDPNSFGQGQIELDGTVNQGNFPDQYVFNYQWVKKNVATQDVVEIADATNETYIVGSAANDDHTEVGVWEYSTVVSYVVNGGDCEQTLVIAEITVTPAPEKPEINIDGGHSRVSNN
jgi:hypothetical protein